MNYFESLRIDWIFEMLQVYGFINRKHLERKFRISHIQASNDLKKATKYYPSMYYNISAKRYELKK